jgi:ABC-type uncharacterized transport system fused permease/ATPase subunit
VEPGFLQRATGIRPRSNLPPARYLFRFRRSWHHAVGLHGLFATDAADSLATLADPKISERLAGKPRVLPAAVEEWSDNPDQRIAEDINQFTNYVLTLSLGVLTSLVTLGSFLFILWDLSGPADIPLREWGVGHIPGYLVWAALLYAGTGTWLTVRIGRPLVQLNFAGQRFEGDFRFSLARLRENAESVASYGGEPVELGVFQERFRNIFANFRMIMGRQMRLNWFIQGYAQVAVIFPLLVVLPRYFVKQIGWGGLMQVASAFSYVYNSLSFIITRYPDIAAWQAATDRLSRFQERLLSARSFKPVASNPSFLSGRSKWWVSPPKALRLHRHL